MDDSRTLYCGNLSSRVTEELLYELFLQAGPLDDIILPKDSSGEQKSFAFIIFKHQCSVDFAIRIFQHTALFERKLDLKPRERGPPASRQQTNNFPIFPSLPNPGFHNQMPYPTFPSLPNPGFQNQMSYPIQFYQQQPFPPGEMVMTLQAGSAIPPQHGQHLERSRCNFHRKFQEDGSYQDDDFRHFEQRNDRREDNKRFKPYRSDSDLGKTHSQYNDSREHGHYRHHMNHEEPRRNDQRERSKHHDDSRRSDNRERSTYYHNDQRRNNQKGKSNYHHHR